MRSSLTGHLKRIVAAALLLPLCMAGGCGEAKEQGSRVFYEIYVGGFYDSDGDGTGDLQGIIQKLNYLNDGSTHSEASLHVGGIYLMPIMPSPTYHKYDVTDYYSVDEAYGTLEDFKELAQECDKRDILLIIDMPVNHTAFANPWFVAAWNELRQGGDGRSTACEYYRFSQDKKNESYYAVSGAPGWYYEAVFGAGMPDLNLDNNAVRQEILDICRFWVDMGADGFRLDAVTSYYTGDREKNTEFLSWLCGEMTAYKDDIYIVGEVWADAAEIAELYLSGIDSLFNFPFSQNGGAIIRALKNADGAALARAMERWQQQMSAANPSAQDAVFLSNHDTLRSGWSFVGNTAMQKQAAAIYLLMPGNAFIYYGEEIGMLGGAGLTDPDKRTPMEWSVTDDTGMALPVPGAADVIPVEAGVAQQLSDSESVLSFYIRVIQVRERYPQIANGIIKALPLDAMALCGFTAQYGKSSVAVVHNLSSEQVSVQWTAGGSILDALTIGVQSSELAGGVLSVPPWGTVIIG